MGHTLFPEIFLEFLLCYFQIYIQIQPVFVYCIIFSTEGRFIIDRARVSQSRGRHCAAGFIAHNGGQRTVQLKANISAWEYHSSYLLPFLSGYIVEIIFSKILRTVAKVATAGLYDMILNLSRNLNFF